MSKEKKETLSDNEFEALFLDDEVEEGNDKSIFSREKEKSDIDNFLDKKGEGEKEEEEEEEKKDNLSDTEFEKIISEEDEEEEEEVSGKLVTAINGLVEKGILQVFVDDEGKPLKDLKDYTPEEISELIESNINEVIESTAKEAPVKVLSSLPKAVQDVVSFALAGGKEENLKGLFKQLAVVQETLDLNPEDEKDAREIIRQHLELENLHTADEIDDQITKIEDLGKIKEYAEKYKKVLDAKQAAVLKKRLADQETKAKEEASKELKKNQSFYEALKTPMTDLELDVPTRQALYHGLALKKHHNDKGEPINELEHLINQKSSGSKEDVELLVKAFAYLKDPETFINSIEKTIRAKVEKELTKDLKDGNKRNETVDANRTKEAPKKKLSGLPTKRPNMFSR